MTARTNDAFGKTDEELAVILRWNAVLEDLYRGKGAVIIDAGQPLEAVVEAVRTAGLTKSGSSVGGAGLDPPALHDHHGDGDREPDHDDDDRGAVPRTGTDGES